MGLELFYVAFLDLTSCRASGFGEGPIPWTAVNDYCLRKEITGEQAADMFSHVQTLDSVYLNFRSKKMEASTRTPVKKGRR
jgi:hypothetical protein